MTKKSDHYSVIPRYRPNMQMFFLITVNDIRGGYGDATFNYIVVVNFIGGGNRSTRRKSQTCRKSLTIFIT